MKHVLRFLRYMNPSIESKILEDIDRRSLRSIHIISLIVLAFEVVLLAACVPSVVSGSGSGEVISFISVCYCVLLCAAGTVLSRKMLQNTVLSHSHFFTFKISFFVLFIVWAIFVDYRHYRLGDQMLTFHTVCLVMVCFVHFRPWIGAVLIGSSYAALYLSLYTLDGAAGVDPFNFPVLALASIASGAVLYHAQINASTKAIRLAESNENLANASRRDGLTGLLNRLALEEDAKKMDGRRMTAYMADINYFKEINDRFGHATGDEILREVSETLKRLFPGGYYYRYGGDEFLVLTHKAPEKNYGSDVYDFEKNHSKILLSIGNAQGAPSSYQELFDLISQADKALYITKKRTHSAEFGGHDRRKNRQ